MDLTSFLENNTGEILALASAFFFAVGTVTISLGTVRKRGDNGAILTVMVTLVVSAMIWAIVSATRGTDVGALFGDADSTLRGLFWFGFAGIMATVFGRMFLFKSCAVIAG